MITVDNEYINCLSEYKFIDLFAGIGGFRYALESFGAKCAFSSEWDKNAQEVYYKNFGEFPAGDITKINEKEIPKHDILCGGFPCQAFSISGKQLGFNDARGTLFFEIARIVSYHKPKILFLENVKQFESHDNGKTLKTIKKILEKLDYVVFNKVLNVSNYGLPQKRKRIYIICFRKDLGVDSFEFPTPTNCPIQLKDIILPDEETTDYIIKRNDIKLKDNPRINKDLFGNYPLEPLRIGTVNKGGQGERIYHEYGHAITLSAYGGGVGAKTGLYLINGKVRKLAPRECARLQGFPDDFKIHESNCQAYKQFGNSVAINVLQYIIIEIIKWGKLNEFRELKKLRLAITK
ncbi:MAG TPA: DNA cytosine methyltransferase [Candidatus Gastranaerophilales bacterium]|nr:DNA cytosine methyltransferase [Candidatus Gastranaerophilales bacterium]